ncbi:HNH endonuclease [Pseudonocardia sp. MH-G8]|uniref:HNH endonuclease n=1 Tax=Pseudonocardia sp. MH-G8 TaxID=1854588 RepID=UPI000BA0B773|nr:HNH endonuclease [Pseudonocardia sp. MH-G8]OZM79647.1 HNH endonuclease [Pseudonocardia sp. MH-G8]
MPAGEDDFDSRLRREAIRWLTVRTHDGETPISWQELQDFELDGKPFRLMDAQRGIRKPKELTSALSIRTVYSADGAARPYDDEVGPDGLLRYKWRGDDPNHAENRALREVMRQGAPLIWFVGIAQGVYKPIYPVYLLWEEPEQQQFVIDPEVARGLVSPGRPVEEQLRRYIISETKRRLHQPVFRATVLRAYETRCAVCALRHAQLLDAAHIVADREEGGIAAVRNGLALCKIHHAAYDSSVLGIRPDLVVEIRADLLEEIDGPMLEHGLKGRHGQSLMALPRARAEQPDRELLEQRYAAFRAAG